MRFWSIECSTIKISPCSKVVGVGRRPHDQLILQSFTRNGVVFISVKYSRVFVLFVCLGFLWKRHHYRWRIANFDLCSALIAIEQWGFFSVPHLLWQGASVYHGLLRGPVIHTYCRAFSTGAVTTRFYDLGLSRLGFEHQTFCLRDQRSNPLHHRRGLFSSGT